MLKQPFLAAFGLLIVSGFIVFRTLSDVLLISDRLFLYGMALLVGAAVGLLIKGKFGLAMAHGTLLLIKNRPPLSHKKDDRDEKDSAPGLNRPMSFLTQFLFLTAVVGLSNIIVSILLALLVD